MHSIVMRIITLLLLMVCPFRGIAQAPDKYILIDSLTQKYLSQKYTINTLVYGYEQGIDLYNVWISPTNLLLLSVLPDSKSGDKWDGVKDQNSHQYTSTKQFLSAKNHIWYLLKREGNTLYKSKVHCHIQLFKVGNYPPPLHFQGKNIINLGLPFMSYNEVKTAYQKIYPNTPFFLETDELGILHKIPDELETIYLSHIEEKNGYKVYRFWTFANDIGISRFAFIEGKGIVGASYDNYFIPYGKYIGNPPLTALSNKEIMWAKEF